MKIYKSISDRRPDIWDKTSCPSKVFHHTEIEEVDGSYEYTVTEYTNKEYINIMDKMVEENTDAIIELAEIVGG